MSNIYLRIMSHTTIRFISSSSTTYQNCLGAQSKFLSKLMKKRESKRKWYKDNPNSFPDNNISIQKKKLTLLHVQRRLTVLNKLFMKYITDLMSTSSTAPEMLEYPIDITYVTLTPDFKIANVYWTHENVNDKNWLTTTEEMLKKYAFTLRHELSQLRIISYVPSINFVKDKTYSLRKEVEDRLAIADFGEDYKPTLTLKQIVQMPLFSEIDNKTSKSDVVNDDKMLHTDDNDIVLPQMRHDVLGLDHHGIMSKIKNFMNQSIHKSKNNTIYSTPASSDVNILTDKTQQELFTQFLKMRKIREKQRNRLIKSKKMEQNPTHTDVDAFDDDKDVETSFDDNFDYDANIYEDEVNNYDLSIKTNEFR